MLLLIGLTFLLLFVYGIFSQKLNEWSISGPMIFALFGLMLSGQLDSVTMAIDGEDLQLVGEIALVIILFTDASSISVKQFLRLYDLPLRLLLIGLPLTMVLGAATAYFMFDGFQFLLLAIMAFMLSPTDAALGGAVVNSEAVPLKVREGINVESGLNDGLVLPPLLICATILQMESGIPDGNTIWSYVGKQLLLAPLVGAAIGTIGSFVISWSSAKGLSNHLYQGISIVALAIIAYMLADHLGGNGFISTFVAGVFFNPKSHETTERGKEYGEFLSQPLALFIFFMFGAEFIPDFWQHIDARAVLYAALSLTAIRIFPVLLSLMADKIPLREKLFIGWFGPRGIASILYLLIVISMLGRNEQLDYLYSIVVLTVTMSIFLHGISAVPYSNWIGRKARR